MDVWKEYVKNQKDAGKSNFAATLEMSRPTLLDDCKIQLQIANKSQEVVIQKEKIDLHEFLRNKLQHDNIEVVTKIQEKNDEERIPYTNKDKYEQMTKENPNLNKLKKELGLDFDFLKKPKKMNKKTLIIILVGVFFALLIFNQTKEMKKIENRYKTSKNDPLNARIYKLDNGLKVYLTVYNDAPRVQTNIAIKAGSKNDPADATGLAHYLEHMLFKGTDMYGSLDYEKEKPLLDKIEALYEEYRSIVMTDTLNRERVWNQIDSISGEAAKYAIANEYDKMLSGIGAKGTNAYTSNEKTVYVNDIPSNQIEKWLKIEAERFRKPVLRLFHTELETVYEEKNRGLDNDGRKMFQALMSGIFKQHQYGTQSTIGTITHLKNPSLVEINKFYDKYYVPNNMAICLSGDFDFDQTIKLIDKYWGGKRRSGKSCF